jgi:ubiquinone/menaquinone biosynthesis C-methylase UbiE
MKQFIEAVNPQPDDSVLDAGCGSGRNISHAVTVGKGSGWNGLFREMLKKHRKMVCSTGLANVRLIPGDVTQTPVSVRFL